MGKIEQIKLARKMLKEEHKQQEQSTQYRNKIFMYGFGTGFVIAVVLSAAFFTSRSSRVSGPNNLNMPGVSSGSATMAPDIQLPDKMQLPQVSATPLL